MVNRIAHFLVLVGAALVTAAPAKPKCLDEFGREFEDGREWRTNDGHFVRKCLVAGHGWQVIVSACASPSNHRIDIGGKRVEGSLIYFCETSSNGGVSLRSEPNPDAECSGGHLPGSRWIDGSFERECQAGAHAIIVGCLSPGGKHIDLNSKVEEQGDFVICERRPDGSVSMRNEPNPNAMCGDHAAGSTWLEDNFLMECQAGGRSIVVGCQLTTGHRLALNSSIRYQGAVIHCQQFNNGTTRIYAEPDPDADCDGHPARTRWFDGSFEKECLPGATTRTTACKLDNGQRVPLGGQGRVDKFIAHCRKFENGTITLTYEVDPNAPCGSHAVGSHWLERNFEKRCLTGGVTDVIGCVTSGGQRIPLNGKIEDNGQLIYCDRLSDGTIRFHGELNPQATCAGGHAAGSRWVDKGFELECQAGARVEVVNCITPEGQRVGVDSQQRAGEHVYLCEKGVDGSVRFRAQPGDRK